MLKSVVIFTHLLLTCIALGMVIYADWCLFRERKQRISAYVRCLLQEMRSFFIYLLAGLWITGIAIVALGYASDGSLYLQNEKLQAKIIVMLVLTINAVVLHKIGFPILDQMTSFSSLSLRKRLLLLTIGSVSSGSWTFAAYLGIARFMNSNFSIELVLSIYVAWLLLVFAGSLVLLMGIKSESANVGISKLQLAEIPSNYEVSPNEVTRYVVKSEQIKKLKRNLMLDKADSRNPYKRVMRRSKFLANP